MFGSAECFKGGCKLKQLRWFLILVFIACLTSCCGETRSYFFSSGNSEGFVAKNLGDAESWGRWSVGDEVVIQFDKSFPAEFILSFNIRAVFQANKGEIFTIKIADQVFEFTGPRDGSMTSISAYDFEVKGIPAGTNTISIKIPKPTSPKQLGLSEDTRQLGLALHSIAFAPLKRNMGCELLGQYW
jgi:hypothetical protein